MPMNQGKKHHKRKLATAKRNNKKDENVELYFMAWEAYGSDFLDEAKFSYVPECLRFNIFYSKGTPPKELPKFTDWLIGHESLTDSEDATWIDLTAYIISMNAKVAANKSCSKCSEGPTGKVKMNLICGGNQKGTELSAILKANKIDLKIIDGRKVTFIDLFKHVCRCCQLIFKDSDQAEKHDKIHHNFLCHNIQCERSKRGNGFYSQEELEIHLRAQKFCKFCPSDVFCTDVMLNKHITENHSKCPCACNEYYERKEDVFEYYYARYPLPCLEEPACETRFKDIDSQAFHHKTSHGAYYPYYCMACYKNEKLVCLKTGEELLKHVKEERHISEDFQFAIFPRRMLQGSLK